MKGRDKYKEVGLEVWFCHRACRDTLSTTLTTNRNEQRSQHGAEPPKPEQEHDNNRIQAPPKFYKKQAVLT